MASQGEKTKNERKGTFNGHSNISEDMEYSQFVCLDGPVNVHTIKKMLDFSFKGEIGRKLLTFFLGFGAIRERPIVYILTGNNLATKYHFLKAVINSFPKNLRYIYTGAGASGKTTLLYNEWEQEKFMYITNYQKNKDLIRNFVQDEWVFPVTEKDEETKKKTTCYKDIPKMSIFTTTTDKFLDAEIQDSAFITELSDSIEQSKMRSYRYSLESGDYSIILKKENEQKKLMNEIEKFFNILDRSYKVEIPFEEYIRMFFNHHLESTEAYHKYFLELIKNIAFFRQSKRDSYEFTNDRTKVLLAAPEDLKLALYIGGEIFTRICHGLDTAHINFLVFIADCVCAGQYVTKDTQSKSIEERVFVRPQLIEEYIHVLTRKGDKPLSERRYRDYIDMFVKKKCLTLMEDHSNNINYYKLRRVPAMKKFVYDDHAKILQKMYELRVKKLIKDQFKIFYEKLKST